MNKNAIRWWVVLGVVLVVYNVLAFALPFPKKAVFAVSYLFTMIAILAQIYVIRTAFYRGEGVKSKFYGFPIAKLGVIYLAVQLIAGLVFMALGLIVPVWLPLALYVVLLKPLGSVLAGTVFLFLLYRSSYRWYTALGISVVVSVVIFVIFRVLLEVNLPVNALGF